MTTRTWVSLFVLFAAGLYLGHFGWPSDAARAAENQAAQVDDIQIRLARGYVKLAELDLQRALEGNQRLPGMFPRTTLESLQETVQNARNRLDQLTTKGDRFSVYVQNAEMTIKVAQDRLAKAQAANKQAAGAIPELELQRLAARVELGQLNLERIRGMKGASPEDLLEWRVDQLRFDLLEMRNNFLFTSARQ